jgi:hypothetical protein
MQNPEGSDSKTSNKIGGQNHPPKFIYSCYHRDCDFDTNDERVTDIDIQRPTEIGTIRKPFRHSTPFQAKRQTILDMGPNKTQAIK